MLRVPTSSQVAGTPQPVPACSVAGSRVGRPSALLVQATASRKQGRPQNNGTNQRADGVRAIAGKGFGNTDPGSLKSGSDRLHKGNAPRFARDEHSSTSSLGQHISKASKELQQKKQGQEQEQQGKDESTYLDQLQAIDANRQQTEEQAARGLQEAFHPPSVADVPKPQRPDREAIIAAQPDDVQITKGFGFKKGPDSTNPMDSTDFVDSTQKMQAHNQPNHSSQEEARRVQTSAPERPPANSSGAQRSGGSGSKEEAHEKLVHAEQLPQPRHGNEAAGIAPVELHGKQQVFTGPQGDQTQGSSGGLPDQPKTETSDECTAPAGAQPAPPSGGLRGEELSGKGDPQRYAALEREAGETDAPSSSTRGASSEHASAHDVAVGAVDKASSAAKQVAGATKHGVEVAAHEAGDAAVAGLNKVGEVGQKVADSVRPVLADAKAAIQGSGEGRQHEQHAGGNERGGGEHILNISDHVDRASRAAERLGARASGGQGGSEQGAGAGARGRVMGEAHYDGTTSFAAPQGESAQGGSQQGASGAAGSADQQLQQAEQALRRVAKARQHAEQRLGELRGQMRSAGARGAAPGAGAPAGAALAGGPVGSAGSSAGGAAPGSASNLPPAGAALAGGPVGGASSSAGSSASSDSSAELQAEIKQLERELAEAEAVQNELDQTISKVKAQQAAAGKSGGAGSSGSGSMAFSAGGSGKGASSREAEMARLGGGAGGAGGSSGGGGGGAGRGGSGRGGEGSGAGAGGEGLPGWVLPAAGVALAFAVYKLTIGKKKEDDIDEQIEKGVAAAKQKAKQQAKQAAEKGKQAGAHALDVAKSKAHDAKGKAYDAKEEAKSKALSASGELKGKAQSAKEKASEKAGQLRERASEAASGAIDTIKREGGRRDTWLAALGVVVGLGLIFGSSGGKGDNGNGVDERGYDRENEAWRGKARKGKQVGDAVSGDINGVSIAAPMDDKYVDYAETYRSGVAASDPGLAGPGANSGS